VRKDWSNVAKDTQETVLRFILKEKDVKGAVKHVRKVVKMLRDKKVPLRELTIYEQLAKPLSEYKLVGPHVVAARKIKERGRPVGAGMIVMFVIAKGKAKESISARAEPVEDIELDDVDGDYYITHQVVPAAMRVLQVLGVTEEQLLEDTDKGVQKFLEK
jgi:DNA polymerase elongation subunit (family B)